MNPARRTTATATTATAVVLATAGALLCTAAPAASAATVTCNSPVYQRQFFANTTFSGTPKRTDCDAYIAENWGANAPATGLPQDMFGVRWTLTRDFGSGGPFALTAAAQDGIRVYVDGQRKIDLWKNVSSTVKQTVNLTIPSGKHTLRVDYAHWNGNANVNFAYAPRTSATIDKVKPLAPAGLTATYTGITQQARLSWRKNVEMDLAGYRVHRRVAGATGWQVLRDVGATATSYTDTPPATGETYEYLVRAYDKAPNFSADSAIGKVTSIAVTAPTGLTATGTDTGIALRWDAVPGAVRYRVVRSVSREDGGGAWETTGTSMTDTRVTRSVENRYSVAAIDASGRVTATTYAMSRTARRLVAAPLIKQAFPHTSAVTLTWDVDTTTGGAYMGFRIYRATGTGTDWAEVTERCRWTRRTLGDGSRQYLCTDSSAGTGTAYRYAVSGFDVNDKEGLRSGEAAATTGTDRQAPAAPASVTTTVEDWGTALTWSKVADADLDEYTVWRGTTVDGVCTDTGKLGYTTVTETSYRDVNVADGENLCYVVRPADFAGNLGAGGTVHLTEHDLRPTVETPAGATHTAWASYSSLGYVRVNGWSPAGTEEYASFRAARWNPQTSTFEALPDSDPMDDESVPRGTSLWYQVVGVRADGTTSLPVLVSVAVPPVS